MHNAAFLFLGCLVFSSGCVQSPNAHPTQPAGDTFSTNSNAEIMNGIVVHEQGGLQVAKAFLTQANGSLLNKANTVQAGDTVFLNLLIQQGWLAENGKVSIGAQQSITTDNSATVPSSSDLFAEQPPVEKEKAGQIQVKTVLTNAPKDSQHLIVRYRIWDKAGPGEVKGSYHLTLLRPTLQ